MNRTTTYTAALTASLLAAAAACAAGLVHSPTPGLEPISPGDEHAAILASNQFGINLFRTIGTSAPNQNIFISPYSMSVALTMAAEGARGQTEAEMASVLAFPASQKSGTRAVSPIHTGNAAIARRIHDAQGNTDRKTRARISELRATLDAANKESEKYDREHNWDKAHKSHDAAVKAASELNTLLTKVDRVDLRVANALWVEKTFSLVPSYISTIDKFYGTGGVTPLNIAGEPDKSRRHINEWVENQTEHRIKDLIPTGALSDTVRLVITNAVYFKGQWADPFDAQASREENFTPAVGNTMRVMMMKDSWRGSVPYAAFSGIGDYFDTPREVPADDSPRPATYPDDHGFQMIELPYKGGEMSMVIIAPRLPSGLSELESKLTGPALDGWLTKLDARTVETSVPRFKMEFASDMSGALKSLGMQRAFISPEKPNGAQFAGMTSSENPAEQLFIGSVLHKSWIEINEKGTEAAAATAIMMAPGAAMRRPPVMVPFNPTFRADRPFLFLIRDAKSGLILFLGRVTNPTT